MGPRLLVPIAALAASSFVLSAAAPPGGSAVAPAIGKASAYGIRVVVPGSAGGSAAVVSAPPDASSVGGSLSYPADGSAVRAPVVQAGAATTGGAAATANATADVSSLTLFNGEITLASASARAKASAKGRKATGDVAGASVEGLVVLGQAVSTSPGTSVALADWGQATVLGGSTDWSVDAGRFGFRASVLALHVRLTKEHGGLPAGSEIRVGYAEAFAQGRAAPPDPATRETERRAVTTTTATTSRSAQPRRRTREPGRNRPALPLVRRPPPRLTPPLTAGGYVFPVFGPTSWGDTFGAPRAAPVGWHHGADIFAPLGTPVLAVASGMLFSVGWNDIGGYRVWLRDREGNEFYYAHLSAFSTLAVDGAQVNAGDVIGFLGATGDAEGTPFHLHFEIHPVSLKWMKYDGAVNPTRYLQAWETLRDVPIVGVAGWAPPIAPKSNAPKPGAILLAMSDISNASGLEPGSLRRALQAPRSLTANGSPAANGPPASARRSSTPR